tara:strand:- start:388 stop:639 length:252 start_codon:yes stop_codon:yes gene_type:complete
MKSYVSTTPDQVQRAIDYLDNRPYTMGRISPTELTIDQQITDSHKDAQDIIYEWLNTQLFEVLVPGYERIREIARRESEIITV